MSRTDVRDLVNEKLPVGKFPVDPRADFRLYIAPEVRRGIEQHSKANVTVEICGVLVGNWGVDENGPYAAVTDYIRCENASSKFAEVTFTHESWAQINKEMDSRFADSRIIGWYHSHPDFGIFLSERDAFIQEHFFSSPGQVAYVIDPLRGLEGVFAWRNGKPKPMPHFWIGNNVRTVEATERNVGGDMSAQATPAGGSAAQFEQRKSWDGSPLGMAAIVLGVLIVFLLGYLYGGWRSRWEQERIIEGAVAHFADTKLIRDGLESELANVRSRLTAIAAEMKKLPAPGDKLSNDELAEAEKRRNVIQQHLTLSEQHLALIEREFGLSETERSVYSRIVALKMAELRRALESTSQPAKKPSSDKKLPQTAAPSGTAAAPPKNKSVSPTPPNEKPKNETPVPTPQLLPPTK